MARFLQTTEARIDAHYLPDNLIGPLTPFDQPNHPGSRRELMEHGKIRLDIAVPASASRDHIPENLRAAYKNAEHAVPQDDADDYEGGVIFRNAGDFERIIDRVHNTGEEMTVIAKIGRNELVTLDEVDGLINRAQKRGVGVEVQIRTYESGVELE